MKIWQMIAFIGAMIAGCVALLSMGDEVLTSEHEAESTSDAAS